MQYTEQLYLCHLYNILLYNMFFFSKLKDNLYFHQFVSINFFKYLLQISDYLIVILVSKK